MLKQVINSHAFRSPFKKERHEQQLSQIQNLEKSFRAITPKKKTPKRNTMNPSKLNQSLPISTTTTSKTPKQNLNRPKTPRKDVPDFQRRFQKQHEQTQQQLAQLKKPTSRKSTRVQEFNLSKRQSIANTTTSNRSNSNIQKQHKSNNGSRRENIMDTSVHPSQAHIHTFEVDQTSLHAILSAPDQTSNVDTRASMNNSRLSLKLPRKLLVSQAPPMRLSQYQPSISAVMEMSPKMKKHMGEIIKSASKPKRETSFYSSGGVSRQLFHDPECTAKKSSSNGLDNLIKAIHESEQPSPVQRQLLTILQSQQNEHTQQQHQIQPAQQQPQYQQPHVQTTLLLPAMPTLIEQESEVSDEEEDLTDHIPTYPTFTPSTKRLLKGFQPNTKKKNDSIIETVPTAITSHHSVFSSSINRNYYFEEEDQELTGLISRITSQSPVRVLSHSKSPCVQLKTNNDPIYNAKMDLESPNDRSGAENPMARVLSNKKSRSMSNNTDNFVQRILSFENYEENSRSPSLFVSLDRFHQQEQNAFALFGTKEVSAGNVEDSMILSP
jgi:hypothetical protein